MQFTVKDIINKTKIYFNILRYKLHAKKGVWF